MNDQPKQNEPCPEDLRGQIRKLQWMVYGVWPTITMILLVVSFVSTREDAAATRVAINWIESTAWNVGTPIAVLVFIVFSIAFTMKVATDYRNRKYRWSLNPGSRRPDAK
jgi:uncharacterized BrkB/YihY/UPF0761 family membrane protein